MFIWIFFADLKQERFYFIGMEYLCQIMDDEGDDGTWLPRELALVEYSLKQGITKTYHQFIWPDAIPTGYTFTARHHCEYSLSLSLSVPLY